MRLLHLFFSLSLLSVSFICLGQSTVQYLEKAGQRPGKCSGSFGQSGLITYTGYKDKELQIGIPCELADFDANGSNDFVFSKCDRKMSCKLSVVLMNGNQVLNSVALTSEVPMYVYPLVKSIGFNFPDLRKSGCKLPPVDTLVKNAKPYAVFALKNDLSAFEKVSECK